VAARLCLVLGGQAVGQIGHGLEQANANGPAIPRVARFLHTPD
jgi:hypothetical protein